MAKQEARRKRDRLALDCVRLGKITFARMGPTSMQEVWEEGYALEELLVRKRKLYARKEELESRRKRLQNSKRAAKKGQGSSTVAAEEPDYHLFEMDLDLAAEAEAVRCHMDQLRRDEVAFAEEERLLESEKASHQKELKRCQSEERSRFYVSLPCLHERYQLLSLLGRGGFSEVWKALDLIDLREVAVKVHQLNPTWTEERKQQYIKHVTREYTIHRELKHPRVVQFFDVFEIDVNSFATVLQYCKGTDLDEKLKRQKTIPEKDAKLILMQIVSGLRYLNTPSPPAFGAASPGPTDGNNSNHGMGAGVDDNLGDRETRPNRRVIIHYDLKPGNILFDEMGDVKITDFGLSKIIDESNEGTSMELTSQGAGTYWYLPPECFSGGIDEPARISSKVDIWSLGVIFYQMLFGRRPFGEGKSQERVLSEGIILNATQVAFPNDPRAQKVSEEAKALIRDCLTHDQRFRPDIHQLSKHDYLKK
jgi:tousled-like kinase